jgi:hypothetical protein
MKGIKVSMEIKQELKRISQRVKGKITEVFNKERLDRIDRESDFVQRSTSKLEGKDFVDLMSTELVEDTEVSMGGMCDILRQINPNAEMTPQGLNQRINTKESVEYLKEVFGLAIQENLDPVREKIEVELLAPFDHVFIEDSTQCNLHEKLADTFKGSGGSASKSALKIDLTYEYKQKMMQELVITDGKTSDQSRSEGSLVNVQARDLLLRDLGYFKLDALSKIEEKGAFFLSRLLPGVDVYLDNQKDATAIDLAGYLDKNHAQQSVIDLDVYLGKEKLPCRLIAYRLPDKVVNMRRRKAKEDHRRKGRTLSEDYLNWLRFGFYITNVSREVWSEQVVGTIYRLRWRIELIFKAWKSLLNIHVLKGTRSERIECLVYGRLITIALMTMLYAYTCFCAEKLFQREASEHKLINWLKRKNRLAKAIHFDLLDALLSDLIHDTPKMLCKQKRKRKTTLQLIEGQVHYINSFSKNESIPLAEAA